MPTPWDGKNLWNGNKNPVRLVAAVVSRNVAVQLFDCFPEISANTTTKPARIPTKLRATCKRVNAGKAVPMGFSSENNVAVVKGLYLPMRHWRMQTSIALLTLRPDGFVARTPAGRR